MGGKFTCLMIYPITKTICYCMLFLLLLWYGVCLFSNVVANISYISFFSLFHGISLITCSEFIFSYWCSNYLIISPKHTKVYSRLFLYCFFIVIPYFALFLSLDSDQISSTFLLHVAFIFRSHTITCFHFIISSFSTCFSVHCYTLCLFYHYIILLFNFVVCCLI